jgi:hypothetical protein
MDLFELERSNVCVYTVGDGQQSMRLSGLQPLRRTVILGPDLSRSPGARWFLACLTVFQRLHNLGKEDNSDPNAIGFSVCKETLIASITWRKSAKLAQDGSAICIRRCQRNLSYGLHPRTSSQNSDLIRYMSILKLKRSGLLTFGCSSQLQPRQKKVSSCTPGAHDDNKGSDQEVEAWRSPYACERAVLHLQSFQRSTALGSSIGHQHRPSLVLLSLLLQGDASHHSV